MLGVPTKRKNVTYHGNSADIGDLDGEMYEYRTDAGDAIMAFRSWWKPSEAELEILNSGGLIELDVLQRPIPPFAINVVTKEEADGGQDDTVPTA